MFGRFGPVTILALLLLCLTPLRLWAQGTTLPGPDQAAQSLTPTWGTNPQQVLEAAAQSGKPVYVYIWARYDRACEATAAETLLHDQVVAQLQNFERLAIDAMNRRNFPFLDERKIPYIKPTPVDPGQTGPTDPAAMTVQGMARWPTHLFLDAHGTEIYREYGFIPGVGFARILGQVRELAVQWEASRQKPDDVLPEANLGHLYTVLKVFPEAKKHLERALALDPENKSGVVPGVQLDLMIIALPDDPAAGKKAVREWQKRNPRHPRLLEALYWEAVGEVADWQLSGDTGRAKLDAAAKLLSRFQTAKPDSPEAKSEWYIPAMELLAAIEQLRKQPPPG